MKQIFSSFIYAAWWYIGKMPAWAYVATMFVLLVSIALMSIEAFGFIGFMITVLALTLFENYFCARILPNDSLNQLSTATNVTILIAVMVFLQFGLIALIFVAFLGRSLVWPKYQEFMKVNRRFGLQTKVQDCKEIVPQTSQTHR